MRGNERQAAGIMRSIGALRRAQTSMETHGCNSRPIIGQQQEHFTRTLGRCAATFTGTSYCARARTRAHTQARTLMALSMASTRSAAGKPPAAIASFIAEICSATSGSTLTCVGRCLGAWHHETAIITGWNRQHCNSMAKQQMPSSLLRHVHVDLCGAKGHGIKYCDHCLEQGGSQSFADD